MEKKINEAIGGGGSHLGSNIAIGNYTIQRGSQDLGVHQLLNGDCHDVLGEDHKVSAFSNFERAKIVFGE